MQVIAQRAIDRERALQKKAKKKNRRTHATDQALPSLRTDSRVDAVSPRRKHPAHTERPRGVSATAAEARPGRREKAVRGV